MRNDSGPRRALGWERLGSLGGGGLFLQPHPAECTQQLAASLSLHPSALQSSKGQSNPIISIYKPEGWWPDTAEQSGRGWGCGSCFHRTVLSELARAWRFGKETDSTLFYVEINQTQQKGLFVTP